MSMMRTATKKFRLAAEEKDAQTMKELFPSTVKLIQKLGQKGIIHKNQASRRVSRLHKLLHKTVSA